MFSVAVPSYKRSDTFRTKTYALLLRHNLLENTTVFVAPEEAEIYRQAYPDLKIIVGLRGIANQRKFIYDYYPEGTQILQIDDDIESVIDLTRLEVGSLEDLINLGFETAEKESCRIWGIYPISNPFFFTPGYSTDLRFIIGAFFGIIKKGETHSAVVQVKDDVYRSCWYYNKDKKILRLNTYAPKTNCYKNKGGMNEYRNLDAISEGAAGIINDFPQYTTLYIRKSTGRPEIRLKDKSKK